jgi:hypothetical protein
MSVRNHALVAIEQHLLAAARDRSDRGHQRRKAAAPALASPAQNGKANGAATQAAAPPAPASPELSVPGPIARFGSKRAAEIYCSDFCRDQVTAERRQAKRETQHAAAEAYVHEAPVRPSDDALPDRPERPPHHEYLPDHEASDPAALRPPALPWESDAEVRTG